MHDLPFHCAQAVPFPNPPGLWGPSSFGKLLSSWQLSSGRLDGLLRPALDCQRLCLQCSSCRGPACLLQQQHAECAWSHSMQPHVLGAEVNVCGYLSPGIHPSRHSRCL